MTDPEPQDGLARQLLKQAETIAALRRELEELAAETTDTVTNLLARIEGLEDIDAMSGISSAPTSWCWRTIGPHAEEALWHELTDWVAWIRHRYPLARRIPDCWHQHPEVVEELTALWLAWQAAYTIPDAPLTAAIEWHDRWLPGYLHRREHGPFALDCTASHRDRPTTAFLSASQLPTPTARRS